VSWGQGIQGEFSHVLSRAKEMTKVFDQFHAGMTQDEREMDRGWILEMISEL